MKPIHTVIPFVAALFTGPCLAQQVCEPGWAEMFSAAKFGTAPRQLIEFDDGSGPAVYTNYTSLAGFGPSLNDSSSYRWNGTSWHVMNGTNGVFGADNLCVHDDGTGLALYGTGFFKRDGSTVQTVVKWTGVEWVSIGEVSRETQPAALESTVSHADDSGPALYVSGQFTSVGGVPVTNTARWDGHSWSAVGNFTSTGGGSVVNLTSVRSGPARGLYASRGVVPKRWDGQAWVALGQGFTFGSSIDAMVEHDFGDGPELVIGGSFSKIYEQSIANLAVWNGEFWHPLSGGSPNGAIAGLNSLNVGGTPDLFVGGFFTQIGGVSAQGCARLGDAGWMALNDATLAQPRAFAAFGLGAHRTIYVSDAQSWPTNHYVRRWDGSTWQVVASGLTDTGGQVNAATEYDEPAGRALFVGGLFDRAGAQSVSNIARWDGSSWSGVGAGIADVVTCMIVYDDGTGPRLYAGGDFLSAGGAPANRIARWDGSTWQPVGTGLSQKPWCLLEFGSGTSKRLLAGCDGVWQWNGSSWTKLGTFSGRVLSLAVFDDGNGPRLYAGGAFGRINSINRGLAVWDGAQWTYIGAFSTGNSQTFALLPHDDGSGPALYAAGDFTSIDGIPLNNIARWKQGSWSSVGAGVTGSFARIDALRAHNDGNGVALFAAGDFDAMGSTSTKNIARWDGVHWTSLGSGVGDFEATALTTVHDASGESLVVLGNFLDAGGQSASHMAVWSRLASWPRITLNPADTTTNASRPVTLSVRSLGPDLAFQWRKDGSPLSDSDRIFGATTRDLTINPVDLSDAGSYDAIVSNDCTQLTSAAATLTVLCTADFDQNTFLNGVDFDAFIEAFELGLPAADIDGSGWVNGVDFDTFTAAFVAGC